MILFHQLKLMINVIIKLFNSIKLSVYCLILLFILVLITTLYQINHGIYYSVETFISSWFITITLPGFLTKNTFPIFPGGMLVSTILLINLIVVHFKRFRFSLNKLGIWLTHFSVIVLIIGSGVTHYFAEESLLLIHEGKTQNYSTDSRYFELVFINPEPKSHDMVYSLSSKHFKNNFFVSIPELSLSYKILKYYQHAKVTLADKVVDNSYEDGLGKFAKIQGLKPITSDDYKNVPTIILSIKDESNGKDYKRLLSGSIDSFQKIRIADKDILVYLREKRHYLPFSIRLNKFIFDRYLGTNVPKNFESQITVQPNTAFSQNVSISMNKPFRSSGYTFFQASFTEDEKGTVLQVVKNFGWTIPYISFLLMTIGLIIQFIISFIHFFNKRKHHA